MNILEDGNIRFLIKDPIKDPGEFIDSGIDSAVFRRGDKAVKFYKNHVSLELARTYQDVTSRSAEYIRENPFNGNMKVDGVDMPFKVSINPVLDIISEGQVRVVGISNYIPGPQMAVLEGLDYLGSKHRALVDINENVPDKEEKDFLLGLMKTVYGDNDRLKPVFNRVNDESLLNGFSGILSSSLGVHGIHVISDNVHVRLNPHSRQLDLIVTDLCLSLTDLEENVQRQLLL